MKERIQKSLANAGVASRRNVEQLVLEGRVAVNGHIVTELPVLIDPEKDKIQVDGENIRVAQRRGARRVYLLLNKPKGVYSTNVAQGVQVRAVDMLPPGLPDRVYPVGRLDAQSKGLLLLTNDGELTHRLTHPKFGVPRSYRAVVDGEVRQAAISQLEKGIWLADAHSGKSKKTGKSEVRVVKRAADQSILEITMREGINPQVRRILAKLGHKVRDLTRTRLGPLTLEGLAVGKVRPLSPREVSELKRMAQRGGAARAERGGN
jgi:23S rRNA pseudouridine2605 synthase